MTRFAAIEIPTEAFIWTDATAMPMAGSERIYNFETSGGRPMTLASNFPYELWLDDRFVGDGGHRCCPGEAIADHWDQTREATIVRVRVHGMDVESTPVLYRCLFEDPFLVETSGRATWRVAADDGVRFAAKASAQLPRQNIVVVARPCASESVVRANLRRPWKVLESPLHKAIYHPVEPIAISSERLPGASVGDFTPTLAEDVAQYVRDKRPRRLECKTYDLGRIALHRFEVQTNDSECVLYYSEVPSFADAFSTRYREKVRLADAFAARVTNGNPFGTRGCRYVHVLHDPSVPNCNVRFNAWRREYPLQWKTLSVEPEDMVIVDACRANLVACVDGGVVDTCWRERAQWTGDLRMSALALRALANNQEVVDLALHQIAQSYNRQTGMVNGAWPIAKPGADFPIPPFHLAFCLTAMEHDSKLERDPLVRDVVRGSLERWAELYLRDGLIQGMPGWYFTDWDSTELEAAGRGSASPEPHAVCNAWWNDCCERTGSDRVVSPDSFDAEFWRGSSYALSASNNRDSPHATAVAATSSAGRHRLRECVDYLTQEIASGRLPKRVTPYFAYFVAKALRVFEPNRHREFVRSFYGPIAKRYGTIYEKTNADASLAHGWSVGVAAEIVRALR